MQPTILASGSGSVPDDDGRLLKELLQRTRHCRSAATSIAAVLARLDAADLPRREEMRKSFVQLSDCRAIDMAVGTKLQSLRAFSGRFPWYPDAFAVPDELPALHRAGMADPAARWILKHPSMNRGQGVSMLRSLDELDAQLEQQQRNVSEGRASPLRMIVQRNVGAPLTMQGYKFHYRLYALLSSACAAAPRLWVYPAAVTRFSTARYAGAGAERKQAHVTNSAVNDGEADYCETAPWAMRTLQAVLRELARDGSHRGSGASSRRVRPHAVMAESFEVVARAFGEGLRLHLLHQPNSPPLSPLSPPSRGRFGRSASPSAASAGCHGVYGVDMMLDAALRVWLIELQVGPQMDCACPQDERLKDGLMRAMLRHALEQRARDPSGSDLLGNVSAEAMIDGAAAAAVRADDRSPLLELPLLMAGGEGRRRHVDEPVCTDGENRM